MIKWPGVSRNSARQPLNVIYQCYYRLKLLQRQLPCLVAHSPFGTSLRPTRDATMSSQGSIPGSALAYTLKNGFPRTTSEEVWASTTSSDLPASSRTAANTAPWLVSEVPHITSEPKDESVQEIQGSDGVFELNQYKPIIDSPPLRTSNSEDDSMFRPASPGEQQYHTSPENGSNLGGYDQSKSSSQFSIHSAPELDAHIRHDKDQSETTPNRSPNFASSSGGPVTSESLGPINATSRRSPFFLWEYLLEEVLAAEIDVEEGVKSERVMNFLTVPGEVEKIVMFGFVICLDSFLYTFTILPLRCLNAIGHLVYNLVHNLTSSRAARHLRVSHKCDLTKVFILTGSLFILDPITDASKMYHSVRGQETIKLYVIFNVLEIADRLCCSFGQDLQDSLFARQALGRRQDGSHPHARPAMLMGLNTLYVVAHTLVLFYQLVTLNVAINSDSSALLTLLISNQFVEIKGSVFKKFEKENLFQLTCADIVERFQLALMLFIIAFRNLVELSSASSSSLLSFLPLSFSLAFAVPSLPKFSLLHTIFSPAVVVLVSECIVDGLKHAFITKFNHIRPAVYGRYIDVLCNDLLTGSEMRDHQPFVDQSPLVSRRLGFAALPFGCLVIRVILQALEMLVDDTHVDECGPSDNLTKMRHRTLGNNGGVDMDWANAVLRWIILGLLIMLGFTCLVGLKLLIGINLRAFALQRYANMGDRLQEERLNDATRPKIGVTPAEVAMDQETLANLRGTELDQPGKAGRNVSLTSIARYDMIKSRVW